MRSFMRNLVAMRLGLGKKASFKIRFIKKGPLASIFIDV